MAGKDKKLANPHNPVTNGKTKNMIFFAMILLGLGGFTAMVFLFIGSFYFSGLTLWLFKGGMIGTSQLCFGALVYAIHSFFDTRESTQKASDKLNRIKQRDEAKLDTKKAKWAYKIEMHKIKKERH